jgi:nucleotide-binding universal stress UspA family protein
MINILVPTDFSHLSKVALQYAIKISNKLDGNITLLNVIDIPQTVRATIRMKAKTLKADLIRQAKEEFDELLDDFSRHSKASNPIKYKVVRGSTSFSEAVKKEAESLRSGLIVMGTHGATGLKKALLGSNTTSVIDVSHVPVLAVPEKAKFKGFRNVIYATDLKHLDNELRILIPYIEKFGSIIHILHIVKNGEDVEFVEERIEKAVQQTGYKNIVTLVTVDADIDGAIDQYVSISKADMLAMFTHEVSFYEKLFDKSFTRKMAFHSKIPLLAFKQE